MNEFQEKHKIVVDGILQVIELCYQQGVTTTWRDIFLFLRFPPAAYEDMPDLDERIVINSESDLVIMRAMISSWFAVKH
jgi:hypothetical protein